MITPILKDPKAHGGTLYTFPSASRDLTRAFSNSEYEFAFSHFVCLNLPDFRYGNYECVDSDSESDIYFDSDPNRPKDPKGIYLDDLYPNSISTVNNLNKSLKWHLQSYVMNCEVAILNGFSLDSGKYDSEILRTPSERIFFNWLQKVKAIKFKGNRETLDGYGYGHDYDFNVDFGELVSESQLSTADRTKSYRIGNKLYTWKGGEWRSRVLVDKTVQYIGTIDMVNNVNIDSDSFNEIYLNIPSNAGRSTNVVFNNIFDDNYGEKGDVIDVDDDIYQKYIDDDKGSYYIIGRDENSQSPDKHTLQAIFDDNEQHKYIIESGYCIDFNDENYSGENGSVGIDAMNLDSNEDFEFNCVLIYYRIRKGTNQWYTNLYGVLFLEEVTTSDYNTYLNDDDERIGYIQRYPKFKKGNSWGLKLDLKIDAQPDSQMELREKEYDDPNGGDGMQLFTEALMQLNDCSKLFYDVKKENTDIEERLYTLENIVSGVDSVYDLRNEVGVLRTKIEMLQPSVDLINARMDELDGKMSKIQNSLGSFIDKISKLDNIFDKYRLIIGDID
jgi:hypothetical protein